MLCHQLPGAADIGLAVERQGNDRYALYRLGPHGFEPNRAAQGVLHALGDQQLDLLRREPRGFRLDGNERWREFRKDVEFALEQGIDAVAEEQAGERKDDAAQADGEIDNGSQHIGSACVVTLLARQLCAGFLGKQ